MTKCASGAGVSPAAVNGCISGAAGRGFVIGHWELVIHWSLVIGHSILRFPFSYGLQRPHRLPAHPRIPES